MNTKQAHEFRRYLKLLEQRCSALEARIEVLERKRGPGRPPKTKVPEKVNDA